MENDGIQELADAITGQLKTKEVDVFLSSGKGYSKALFVKTIENAIKDEDEAIRGYDGILLLLENSDDPNKEKFKKTISEIREEECVHVTELRGMIQ